MEFVPRNLRESVKTFVGIRCHRNHMVVRNGEDTAMWESIVFIDGERVHGCHPYDRVLMAKVLPHSTQLM